MGQGDGTSQSRSGLVETLSRHVILGCHVGIVCIVQPTSQGLGLQGSYSFHSGSVGMGTSVGSGSSAPTSFGAWARIWERSPGGDILHTLSPARNSTLVDRHHVSLCFCISHADSFSVVAWQRPEETVYLLPRFFLGSFANPFTKCSGGPLRRIPTLDIYMYIL